MKDPPINDQIVYFVIGIDYQLYALILVYRCFDREDDFQYWRFFIRLIF